MPEEINGIELAEGEECEMCGCIAEDHGTDGCSSHPECLNFYPSLDWEYLAIDDEM